MGLFDAFRYDGKRVLVVGGATGMGAAAAELVQDAGAEVVVMDFAEVTLPGAKAIHVNLADKASIEAAVDECGGPVHALFSCAGVADGTPGIEKINFVGHRHLIDRMLAGGMLSRGSAIGFISSAAGLGWESNLETLKEYLDTADFDAAVGLGGRARLRRLLPLQAGGLRLRGPGGVPAAQAGDPDQRHLPGADRHPARPGQQGDVARVRRRLPRGGRASRPRRRSSRRTRSCSSAATPPWRSPASP